jgi:DUF4097 and DUF4098 domain-containing protein YvlB
MLSADGSLPISTGNNYTDSVITNIIAVDESERFEQTYPLNANGTVSVSNVNGSITIETWDRNEVRLAYVKTADTKENLDDVQIRIDARQDAFAVETEYEAIKNRATKTYKKLEVEYRLTVPRAAVLNDIETVNGSVSISNAANMTKASTVNGEVRGTNLRGTANLSTVNGTVVADFDQLQAGGRVSLNTVNGTVDLMIPSDANATIKADTVNGSISNDFGLPVRKGEYVGRDLYGRVGSGDVQIRLNSVNGALSIKRKNDGKNVNPATNLLNSKSEDNEDWEDGEDNSRARPPKPPKPPKAPKPPKPPVVGEIDNEAISQSIEQSLKEAENELAKIKPELEKTYADALKQASIVNMEQVQKRVREAAKYSETLGRRGDGYWTIGSPAIEKKEGSFGVKGIPKVKVEARNCAVFVRGWDKPEVQYTITRLSKSRTPMPLDLKATVNGSNVDIKILNINNAAHNADFSNEMNRTRIEIFVPQKSDLKIMTTGEIRLEGVSGAIDLQGADEAINVRDADGKLTVAAADGRIRVIGFRGAFDGKTDDGAMNLEGDFQKFSAQTVDGTITLTLPDDANVNIESNRKDITGEGLSLDYQGDGHSTSTWKVGRGGANHLLYTTADGRVFVRSASAFKSN